LDKLTSWMCCSLPFFATILWAVDQAGHKFLYKPS
jgi:hypothetical protein